MPTVDVRTIDRGTYSAATTYSYGDLVTYNGTQYVFTAYTPAAGATPPAGNWTTAQTIAGATTITPQFGIDSVTTLPAGSAATAVLTGTAANPTLALGIPRGIAAQATSVSLDASNRVTITFADGSSFTSASSIGQGTAIKGVWSPASAYVTGDVVVANGALYQFTGASAASSSTINDTLTTSQTQDAALTLTGTGARSASGLTFSAESSLWRDFSSVLGIDVSVDMTVTGTLDGNNLAGMFLGGPNPPSFPTRRALMLLIWWSSTTTVNINWYDASGNGTSLATGTTAAVSSKRRIRYTTDANRVVRVFVDGTQVAQATIPSAIVAGRHGIVDTGTRATWGAFSSTTSAVLPTPANQLLLGGPTVGAWTAITLTNGTAAGPPPMYRINGDVVEFRGAFTGIAAPAQSASSTITTMPVGFRPPGQALGAIGTGQAGTSNIIVETTGVMYIYQATAGSTGTNYRLDGLRYSITP